MDTLAHLRNILVKTVLRLGPDPTALSAWGAMITQEIRDAEANQRAELVQTLLTAKCEVYRTLRDRGENGP
jgi:hypothetical protein